MMNTHDAPILVVDDEPHNVMLLQRLLMRSGYTNVHPTTDPFQVEQMVRELDPDVILMDLNMPGLHGRDLMTRLAAMNQTPAIPVIVLTGDGSPEARRHALREGASDFVSKPFDPPEVVARISNQIQTRLLEKQLLQTNQRLEEQVAERTRQLEESQLETLNRLSLAAELRDDDTGCHVSRVSEYAACLARAAGLAAERCELIRRAAPLHDIGKIGIPDSILLKPGKLTDEEFATMKSHVVVGARILEGSTSLVVRLAETIALTHHERWDGRGYPNGLIGSEIPLEGRIVAICDVFDALTSERPYKQAWPVEKAVAEIERCSGSQFDADLVTCFLRIVPELVAIRAGYDRQRLQLCA